LLRTKRPRGSGDGDGRSANSNSTAAFNELNYTLVQFRLSISLGSMSQNYYNVRTFRFLRQPSRPKPPRPVANSGNRAVWYVVKLDFVSLCGALKRPMMAYH
jgi:hypothetical protein